MSSKPKKTLSEEQLKKMQEGRRKAAQKRAKEREEAKAKAKELNDAKKSKDKEKLLQLELEALQQQQDRINNLKMQVERKKQVKSKLKSIKEVDEKPADQVYEKKLSDDEEEEVIEALEEVEEKINKQIEHKETDDRDYVPNDEEYVATFAREAHKMRKNIPAETRKYYDEAIKKFDFTLSLDDNISSMIDYVKEVVKNNTELANGIRNKQIQRENKKEIVQKNVAEKVAEQSVDSKLHKLMKLK